MVPIDLLLPIFLLSWSILPRLVYSWASWLQFRISDILLFTHRRCVYYRDRLDNWRSEIVISRFFWFYFSVAFSEIGLRAHQDWVWGLHIAPFRIRNTGVPHLVRLGIDVSNYLFFRFQDGVLHGWFLVASDGVKQRVVDESCSLFACQILDQSVFFVFEELDPFDGELFGVELEVPLRDFELPFWIFASVSYN